MGAKPSSISDLKNNSLLRRFVSEEKIAEGDKFWEELLAFSFIAPSNSADNRLLEEATEPLCEELVKNTVTTKNFVTLIELFIKHANELKSDSTKSNIDNVFDWETYNILLLIRCFGKYFIGTLSDEEVRQQFGAVPNPTGSSNNNGNNDSGIVDDFFCSLVNVIVTVPLSPDTYGLHVEAINTLVVLLSVQMVDVEASTTSIFYEVLMKGKCSERAGMLVRTMLKNFVKYDITPSELLTSGNAGILSSLWSWFAPPEDEVEESLLAHQSQLLLLLLVNHCTQDKTFQNPYRKALFSFHGRKGSRMSESESSSVSQPSFTINLSMLFQALCRDLQTDQTTLLLYLLLHRNPHVASYILSRTDIDSLVLPILELLYHAEEQNSHHIYMTLIVLLILSQDENFNKLVHEIVLHNIPWYTERVISNITLGGLLVLVVIRTIQYNMTKMRDKYLHTNCLATLANMSSQFHALHPYVTQRLISLYALLSKKHAKISDYVKNATDESSTEEADTTTQDHVQDLAILEEVLRMVLEIINSCLTNTLHHNPNLIYTLLHQRELFAQFRTHPTFHDIIENIDTVLAFFITRLEQHPHQTLSVQVVLDVIKQGALQWPRDRLKKFPELKFKYVEEDQPEEFFVPYVWSLVYKTSRLYWNPSIIQLFHPPPTT